MESELKHSILVIEDEVALRELLVERFAKEGFTVLHAADGKTGLQIARSKHPDLILLDLILPELDGMTLFKNLREENEWGKAVPVIILSNLSPIDDYIIKEIAINQPAYYLVKTDWPIDEVVAKVNEIIS